MADRSWQAELETFLSDTFASTCQTSQPQPGLSPPLYVHPPLTFGEAKYFILGMEASLFELDGQGHLHSPLASAENEIATGSCDVFATPTMRPRLVRERICQLATASALILDRGWLTRQIELGSGRLERTTDILVRSLNGELIAAVKVKRTPQELAKFRGDFFHCCRRGNHPIDNCGFPQNHPQFEFCASHKPRYLWGVAPGTEVCFKLSYGADSTIELEELSTLPPRSRLELA